MKLDFSSPDTIWLTSNCVFSKENNAKESALIQVRITVDGMTASLGGSSYAPIIRLNGHNWSSGL